MSRWVIIKMKKIFKTIELALVLVILASCSLTEEYDISGKFTIDVPEKYTLMIDDGVYEFYDSNNEKILYAEYVDGYAGYMYIGLAITSSEYSSNFEDFYSSDGEELMIATIFDTTKLIVKKGENTISGLSNKSGQAYLITNVNMNSNDFNKVLESFKLK